MSKFVGLIPVYNKYTDTKMPLQGYTVINASAQVACGSCVELMRAIPDESVDLVLTDPPYNLGLFMKERGTNSVLTILLSRDGTTSISRLGVYK